MSDSFSATRWSIIEQARGDQQAERREALETLLTTYMPALRSHLVRRKRISPDLAEELLQGFLVKNVVEGQLIERADATAGKFRSWLLKWLENYVRHEFSRTKRESPLEEENQEGMASAETDLFDVEWARATLADTVELMQGECRAENNEDRWQVFQKRLLEPLFSGEPPVEYDILVNQLNLDSKAQAQNHLVSAKRHFQRSLETIVGRYAASDEDVVVEIRELHRVLVSARLSKDLPIQQNDQATIQPEAMNRVVHTSPKHLAALFQMDVRAIWARCLASQIGQLIQGDKVDGETKSMTLHDFFHHPQPSMQVLRSLKQLGNSCVQQESKEFPVEIGLAVYLTAIAVGQVRLGKWISNASKDTLRPGFEYLKDSNWLDEETLVIHKKAMRELAT